MEAKTICFCFGYTDKDIIEDVRKHHGKSSILEKIKVEKARGKCRCAELNPKGR